MTRRAAERAATRMLGWAALLSSAMCWATPAHAADLLSGFGGDSGFGELAMTPNDDNSSSLLNLPFAINFYGQTYSQFFVNNNGNITFQRGLGTFTPQPFPVTNQPMIAPWWADVDTTVAGSGGGSGEGEVPTDVPSDAPVLAMAAAAAPDLPGANNVYVASPNADTVVVTWDRVGYFSARTDKTNSFQLVLRNRADTGNGNFDFDFRYQQLQWTTGDASGGVAGLAGPTGTPAQAGYDAGDNVHFLTLPGSRTDEVLNLQLTSNVGSDTPGLWTFAVRNGETPGASPSNPLLPVVVDGAYQFDFNVQANTTYFIDPDVAVGYDYLLESSDALQSFASVVISTEAGDGEYALFLWDGLAFSDSGVRLRAGETYTFAAGTARFSIRGIEIEAGLDPANTQAFVTGLSFTRSGPVGVTQTPLVMSVPEPGAWLMAMLGLGVVGATARRRRA